ncbi:hypothetical protein EP073_03905 [Geovibrio thiophilus]|uniref:6-bladed beta-propeller n=1 Tax=Geovibrio thiophilus TaxID=139438 RepID=A0A410JWY5_9BACT|nr:NHL repeat-containing protein [Geovibrio thiophilus]QAR32579.1 hypothetical protein EP073_03905 [Geovibrio thiophilus]
MKILLAAVIIFSAITQGHALEFSASLLYKVTSGKQTTPADVVIESSDTAGVYDAFNGSYTVYKNGSAVSSVKKEFLKGGNCFVRNGNYYLFCNSKGHSLDMISSKFEVYSSAKLAVFDPTDVVVSSGYAYVADNDNHRIVKIDLAEAKEAASAGRYGKERLQFWYPYAVAFNQSGQLLVSEVLNTRIQKITKELKFYEFIGGWGINQGQFYRPTGIALHKGVNLFVADGYTGLIQYFDKDGKFAGVLTDASGKKLRFGSVTHIRINGNTLAVVDAFEKTVFIFQLKEKN